MKDTTDNLDEVNKSAEAILKELTNIVPYFRNSNIPLEENDFNDKQMRIKIAIIHVEKIVELLKALANNTIFVHVPPRKVLWDLIHTNNQILSNLKKRIK